MKILLVIQITILAMTLNLYFSFNLFGISRRKMYSYHNMNKNKHHIQNMFRLFNLVANKNDGTSGDGLDDTIDNNEKSLKKSKKFVSFPFSYHEELNITVDDITNLGIGVGRALLADGSKWVYK